MIILGEAPPFEETKDDRFGEVINRLNDIQFEVAKSSNSSNAGRQEKLDAIVAKLDLFVNESIIPIDEHISLRGAVHGETKNTIGLGFKDNYRAATVEESLTGAAVNAFVTPAGAAALLDKNFSTVLLDKYQQNNVVSLASFYPADELPVVLPTTPEKTRYLVNGKPIPIVINGDRLMYSPLSNLASYTTNVVFTGLPVVKGAKNRLAETINVKSNFVGHSWNQQMGATSNGKVTLFTPYLDKGVYDYTPSFALTSTGAQSFLMFKNLDTRGIKGITTSMDSVAGGFSLKFAFFKLNDVAGIPTMTALNDGTYRLLVDTVSQQGVVAAVRTNYRISDLITLPSGATAVIDPEELTPTTSMYWVTDDQECRVNYYLPIVITKGALVRKFYLKVTESWVLGTLLPNTTGTMTQLGGKVKDIVSATLEVINPNFLFVNDRFNINNPVQLPGVVLNNGLIIKGISGKYGMRIKRYDTQTKGLRDWSENLPASIPMAEIPSEMFAPARHAPMGVLPERLIPFTSTENQTQYFAYGLNSANGIFEWAIKTWDVSSIVDDNTANVNMKMPSLTEYDNTLASMPNSVVVMGNRATSGVTVSALGFTSHNSYIGRTSFDFSNRQIVLGENAEISLLSMLVLRTTANVTLDRAKDANPTVPVGLRKAQIQVYAVTVGRALIFISDGVNYAEAGFCAYTLNRGVFKLEFGALEKPNMFPVTTPSSLYYGKNRSSESNDGVWSEYSDLLVIRNTINDYDVLVTRAFGEVYGDVSFNVGNINSDVTPTLLPTMVNPARFFEGINQIDSVEELIPGILIPGKGIYQTVTTPNKEELKMSLISGNKTMDIFTNLESGWVRVPAGTLVMLGGKSFIIDQDIPVKVNPAGTTYCYLQRAGETIMGIGSDTLRDVLNNEVLFGISRNGVLEIGKSYIVIAGHVLTSSRNGAGIPVLVDDGGTGVNNFFKAGDVT